MERQVDLARLLEVGRTAPSEWKSGKKKVPWKRMKDLVDEKGIRWDWLLLGTGPMHHNADRHPLDRAEITKRFVSLLPDETQEALGKMLGVTQVTIHRMQAGKLHVPWGMLEYAVENYGATWEWLLEGRGRNAGT